MRNFVYFLLGAFAYFDDVSFKKISFNMFWYHLNIVNDSIKEYIKWFEEAYLLNKVLRFDIKGRGYIRTLYKYILKILE